MTDKLAPIVVRFNEALRSKMIEVMRGKKTRFGPPNESTIAVCEPWSSNSTILPPLPDLASSESVTEESLRSNSSRDRFAFVPPSQRRLSGSESSSTISLAPGLQIKRKIINGGRSVFVHTGTIFFDFSLAHCFDDHSDAIDELGRSFWIGLENVDFGTSNSGAARHVIDIDVDAMQPGSMTVVPSNSALNQTKLVFKRKSQAVLVKFYHVN